MALSGGAKLGLAALAVWLLARGGSAKASVVSTSGPKKAKFSTYDGDVATWAKRRYELAHDYFAKYWSTALDEQGQHDAALSVLAHWSLETNGGANESNFNVGNIHAVGSQAWYGSGDTSTAGKAYSAQFAAYDSLDDGITAYFTLLENDHYKDCLEKLASKPADADWFKCLGQKGYYAATMKGQDNIEPAAAGWAARRALLAQYAT